MNTVERLVRDHPLFCGMEDEYIRVLVMSARATDFRPNQYIFQQGEDADQFYIIESGRVVLEMQTPRYGPVAIDTLCSGDIMGWSWLFPPFRWHYDARVLDPTHAILIDGHYLRARCHEDPRLAHEITRRFALIIMQRLHMADQKLAAIPVENGMAELESV